VGAFHSENASNASVAGVAIWCFPFGQRCGALSMLSLVVQIVTGVLYEGHASEISNVNKADKRVRSAHDSGYFR